MKLRVLYDNQTRDFYITDAENRIVASGIKSARDAYAMAAGPELADAAESVLRDLRAIGAFPDVEPAVERLQCAIEDARGRDA